MQLNKNFNPDPILEWRGYNVGQLAFRIGLGVSFLLILIIWLANPRLTSVDLLPDKGATWYFWKLASPSFWSQATAWGGYILHQLFMWGTILYARKTITNYTSGLYKINLIALFGNVAFIGLHFLQTQIWYDGLAQNVPLTSAEASVVFLLIVVLIMENRRRGLFFGKKVPFSQAVLDFFKHYHGFMFSWAIVYTFWFHPMVATSGHLVGFFYIFMLLLQGSLFYTRMHLNRWWTVSLELMVLFHGAMVVYMLRGTALWAFVIGFLGIFLITQMHGVKLRAWMKWVLLGMYLTTIIIAFSSKGFAVGRDILLLPILEYGLVFIVAGLTWLGIMIYRRRLPWSRK